MAIYPYFRLHGGHQGNQKVAFMDLAAKKTLGLVVFFICLWPLQNFPDLLEFDREKIFNGEIWRIWTAHFVHSNGLHFALNMSVALPLYWLCITAIKKHQLLLCSIVFSTLISIILLLGQPHIDWYNGLSGLLHALATYFFVLLAISRDKMFWGGLILIWLKVLSELIGLHYGHESLIGNMRVITEAHFIGAIIGTLSAFLLVEENYKKLWSD